MRFGGRGDSFVAPDIVQDKGVVFHGIEAATFEHAYGFKGFAPSMGVGCQPGQWTC